MFVQYILFTINFTAKENIVRKPAMVEIAHCAHLKTMASLLIGGLSERRLVLSVWDIEYKLEW